MTPHSAKESSRYMLITRNFNLDAAEVADGPIVWKDEEICAPPLGESAGALLKMMETIYQQDFIVVGNQRPEELPWT